LSGRSSICESFSEFVAVHAKEVRTLCFNGIHQYFAPISAFWILVRVFEKNDITCPHEVLFVIYKSCSVFVAELVKEAKTCCCVGILKVFCSDQCFLYFGAEFQENY